MRVDLLVALVVLSMAYNNASNMLVQMADPNAQGKVLLLTMSTLLSAIATAGWIFALVAVPKIADQVEPAPGPVRVAERDRGAYRSADSRKSHLVRSLAAFGVPTVIVITLIVVAAYSRLSTSESGTSGFSATEFERTKQWLRDERDTLDDLQSNQIAYDEAFRTFAGKLPHLVGTTVTWDMPVYEVTDRYVRFDGCWDPPRGFGEVSDNRFLRVDWMADDPNLPDVLSYMSSAALPSFESRPWNVLVIGKHITRQTARSLKHGDSVTIQGIIRDACIPDPVLSNAEARRLRGKKWGSFDYLRGELASARGRRGNPHRFNRVKERPCDQVGSTLLSSINPEAARIR